MIDVGPPGTARWMTNVTVPRRPRLAAALLFATTSMTQSTPAAAQVCGDAGWTVDCLDGTCCMEGGTCIEGAGGDRCRYDEPGGGGTCAPTHPVKCEATLLCCPEGTTCGDEGCCADLDIPGCTVARECSGDPNDYYVVDGVRFDCTGDDCSNEWQKVNDHCRGDLVEDDSGCAIASPPGGHHRGAAVALVGPATLFAAAALVGLRKRRARRRSGSTGGPPQPTFLGRCDR